MKHRGQYTGKIPTNFLVVKDNVRITGVSDMHAFDLLEPRMFNLNTDCLNTDLNWRKIYPSML